MPDLSDLPDRPASRGRWTLILLLLAPAVLLPLWVSLYDREEPTLGGWPFFFWFQMALIIFAVAVTAVAYALVQHADREDRVRHGLPAVPPEPDGDREAGR